MPIDQLEWLIRALYYRCQIYIVLDLMMIVPSTHRFIDTFVSMAPVPSLQCKFMQCKIINMLFWNKHTLSSCLIFYSERTFHGTCTIWLWRSLDLLKFSSVWTWEFIEWNSNVLLILNIRWCWQNFRATKTKRNVFQICSGNFSIRFWRQYVSLFPSIVAIVVPVVDFR